MKDQAVLDARWVLEAGLDAPTGELVAITGFGPLQPTLVRFRRHWWPWWLGIPWRDSCGCWGIWQPSWVWQKRIELIRHPIVRRGDAPLSG